MCGFDPLHRHQSKHQGYTHTHIAGALLALLCVGIILTVRPSRPVTIKRFSVVRPANYYDPDVTLEISNHTSRMFIVFPAHLERLEGNRWEVCIDGNGIAYTSYFLAPHSSQTIVLACRIKPTGTRLRLVMKSQSAPTRLQNLAARVRGLLSGGFKWASWNPFDNRFAFIVSDEFDAPP